jgi:hypothetical protein
MLAVPHGVLKTAEDIRLMSQEVEFGAIEKAAFFEGVLPDIEDLVDRAESVDLEFIIAVRARDKELDIILRPDERISLGESGLDIGFFHPEARIKIIIIPEGGHPCIQKARDARDEVDEPGRFWGVFPILLVEPSVNRKRLRISITRVMKQVFFGTTIGGLHELP